MIFLVVVTLVILFFIAFIEAIVILFVRE